MATVGDTIINEAAISGQIAKLDKAQVEENEKLIDRSTKPQAPGRKLDKKEL